MIPLYIMHKSRNLSEKKRRDQFNMLINELCSMVTSSNRKMDKSSVLRSTISFLKNQSELTVQSQSVKVPENWKPSFLSNEEFTHLMLEALDGFIIVFSCNGQILYTSESTASLLGYLPSRIYSSIFDIIHEMDKSSLYKLISNPPSSSNNSISKDTFLSLSLHMKRGPIHPHENSTYELVQLLGSFYHWPSSCEAPSNQASFDCDSNSCSSICSLPPAAVELRSCFVAVGRLQTPHLLRIVNLPDDAKNEFTSRHSLEWKFLFLDHRAPPIIGYLPFEVLGTSGYDYYHVDDLDNIAASHELLMNTGEGTSCFYRFLTKGQQWIWLQTRYYISYHQWNSKPEFIVCTHTVVSTEKVLKSLQDMPKAVLTRLNKPPPCVSSSPTQSACLSPSPSVSSLGSLSSEPPTSEQGAPKASNHTTSVLFTSTGTRERASSFSRSQYHDSLSSLPDSFLEPPCHPLQHNPLAPKQRKATTHSPPNRELQVHVSPSHAPPVPSPLMRSPDLPMQQFQAEQRSPTQLNPVHMNPDYLRHRHRLLQQQIMAQQEELRRVSEQLMMVEFANPNSQNLSGNPYQDMIMSGGYMDSQQYQNARQPLMVATSTETVMRSVEEFTVTTSSMVTEEPRTYLNLEANMCVIGPNQMTHLSQQSEVISQGYSINRQLQPPNS